MEMQNEDRLDLQSQGERTPSVRRSGDIVPVPAASSSNDGPAVESEESLAVALEIASTSGGPVERVDNGSCDPVSSPVDLSMLPEIRLTRVDTSEVFQPSLPQRWLKGKSARASDSCGQYGSPPPRKRAQSSIIVISDEEPDTDSSITKNSDLDLVAKGDRPRRGRPPTTGEWVNITKVKAEYVALREKQLELDEVAYILDPNTIPKQTWDKLSDISCGLNGRLKRELRVEARKLKASLAELRFRAYRQKVSDLQIKGNDYLRKQVERLKGELDVARAEILSLRALTSPTGRSPPHKKVRGLEDSQTREVGTQMEIGDSPDPSMVPLPMSPILGRSLKADMVDRGCSPVWRADVSLAPSSSCRGGKEVATATSPTLGGGLTSAETSLMALLEGVVAEREASRGEINRLRDEFDSLSKDIVSLAGESRRASVPVIPAMGKEKKRKKAKKKKRSSNNAALLPRPSVLGVIGGGVDPAVRTSSGEEAWTTVVRRGSRRRASQGGDTPAGVAHPRLSLDLSVPVKDTVRIPGSPPAEPHRVDREVLAGRMENRESAKARG
ncbi:bhlh transcription factor [Lasius niger]|uniref:Bhlh transcription factor n=1 Tax=Lasius niger TaxID=67767 RepID=A0A0J7K3X1_LASNI|nr:bhlh transcription factor [Lasius niger]